MLRGRGGNGAAFFVGLRLVPLESTTSNSLFSELSDWNEQLNPFDEELRGHGHERGRPEEAPPVLFSSPK